MLLLCSGCYMHYKHSVFGGSKYMLFQLILRNTDVQATEHYVIKDPFCVH